MLPDIDQPFDHLTIDAERYIDQRARGDSPGKRQFRLVIDKLRFPDRNRHDIE